MGLFILGKDKVVGYIQNYFSESSFEYGVRVRGYLSQPLKLDSLLL
jgi:hypothetical protein